MFRRKWNNKTKQNVEIIKQLKYDAELKADANKEGTTEEICNKIYDVGYINALEFVLALFEERDPDFLTSPDMKKEEQKRTVSGVIRRR